HRMGNRAAIAPIAPDILRSDADLLWRSCGDGMGGARHPTNRLRSRIRRPIDTERPSLVVRLHDNGNVRRSWRKSRDRTSIAADPNSPASPGVHRHSQRVTEAIANARNLLPGSTRVR